MENYRDPRTFGGTYSLLSLLLLLLSRFSRVQLCATSVDSSVPGILQARILSLLYSYKASENTVLWDARLSWSNGAHDETMNEPGIPFQKKVYTS